MVTSFQLTPICVVSPYQARRQEMKWGRGCKKVENGGAFVESGKWGVFCKKVDLSSTHGALCTVSVFFILHFSYLGWGVRTHPTHPPAYGPGYVIANQT